jgi:hypothetical protein
MSRPSRADEAKEKLRAYYAEHGGMPSIKEFAKLMEYASTSSALDVTNALVEAGYLVKEQRGGRLLPGPRFGKRVRKTHDIPVELLEALPKDVKLVVLRVPKASLLVTQSVLAGDCLVLAPPDRADLSATLLLARGRQRRLASELEVGWKVAGVVVAQFRRYA